MRVLTYISLKLCMQLVNTYCNRLISLLYLRIICQDHFFHFPCSLVFCCYGDGKKPVILLIMLFLYFNETIVVVYCIVVVVVVVLIISLLTV